MLQIFTT
jgi:hypothetical protein